MRSSFKRRIEKSIIQRKSIRLVDKKINFILPDHDNTPPSKPAAEAVENINTNPLDVLIEQPIP